MKKKNKKRMIKNNKKIISKLILLLTNKLNKMLKNKVIPKNNYLKRNSKNRN